MQSFSGLCRSALRLPLAQGFSAFRIASQKPVWSQGVFGVRSQFSGWDANDENVASGHENVASGAGWQNVSGGTSGPSGWWIDNKGKDWRMIGKEDYSQMKNPEKAEAMAVFLAKPGLTVMSEEIGLDYAMRRLARKVAQEGILDKFRAQRVRRKERQQAEYKRWKTKMNRYVWGATTARQRGF